MIVFINLFTSSWFYSISSSHCIYSASDSLWYYNYYFLLLRYFYFVFANNLQLWTFLAFLVLWKSPLNYFGFMYNWWCLMNHQSLFVYYGALSKLVYTILYYNYVPVNTQFDEAEVYLAVACVCVCIFVHRKGFSWLNRHIQAIYTGQRCCAEEITPCQEPSSSRHRQS